MKKYTFLLLLCFLASQLFSQEHISLESPELDNRFADAKYIPKVSGNLLNYSTEVDSGLFIKYVIVTPTDQRTKTAEIEEDGGFILSLDNALPYQEIFFSVGEHYYGRLIADSELLIEVDMDLVRGKDAHFDHKGVKFQGIDGPINQLSNKFISYDRKQQLNLNRQLQVLTMSRDLSSEESVQRLNGIFAQLTDIESQFLQENIGEDARLLENERLSEYYAKIFRLHWKTEMADSLFQLALSHKPLLVSNASTEYYRNLAFYLKIENPTERVKNIKETIPPLLSSVEEQKVFKQYIGEYEKRIESVPYDTAVVKKGGESFLVKFKEELVETRLDKFIEKLTNLPDRKFYIGGLTAQPEDLDQRATYLSKLLPKMNANWASDLMNDQLLSDKKEQVDISKKLSAAMDLAPSKSLGEPLLSTESGADLYIANQENVDELLGSILRTYKDEAVILDIWATWCAPCISDMKQSKSIKEELKKMPVKVVYLCVDSNSSEEKWKRKVAALDVSGDHIFLNSSLSAEIMSQFKLGGFPSYLFINQQREIDKYYIQGISRIDIADLKKKI